MHRALAAVFAAAVITACSAPPDKERHQAEGAIAAARAAGAAVYAADTLATAEAALAKYDAAVASRDYRQALRVALEARDGAYEAARRAANEKARARSEAERLFALAEAAVARLDATPPTASPRVPATGHDQRAAAAAVMQEARRALNDQEFADVIAALEPLLAQLDADASSSSSHLPR